MVRGNDELSSCNGGGPDDDMHIARGFLQQASALSASKRCGRQYQLERLHGRNYVGSVVLRTIVDSVRRRYGSISSVRWHISTWGARCQSDSLPSIVAPMQQCGYCVAVLHDSSHASSQGVRFREDHSLLHRWRLWLAGAFPTEYIEMLRSPVFEFCVTNVHLVSFPS
jgi:hypothetical protein